MGLIKGRKLQIELTTALEALQVERDINTKLERKVEDLQDLANEADNRAARLDRMVYDERAKAKQDLDVANKHNMELFTRRNVEHMSRAQLVSLIEEAINEARRKGMVEAEGLMTRHQTFTSDTDLELMRGVVRTYQERISAEERRRNELAVKAATPVKLDTRPLAEKMQPAGQTILVDKPTGTSIKDSSWFRSANWWRTDVVAPTPAKLTAVPDFASFDQRAKVVTQEAKVKAFVEGSSVPTKGFHGGTYILERHGDVFSCTCPAWKYNKAPTNQRTCKHLERYLGEATEMQRLNKARTAPQPSCWCGVLLVRGQCQIHSRDWKGDESCTCGRKFASCKAAFDTISVAQRSKGHQPRLTVLPAGVVNSHDAMPNFIGMQW